MTSAQQEFSMSDTTTTNNTASKSKAKGPAKTMSEADARLAISKGEPMEAIVANGGDPMMLLRLMKEENERLASKAKVAPKVSFKVSDKGACSIYGFGRFPITLYSEQVTKLSTLMPDLLKFCADNADEMKRRSEWAKTPEGIAALKKKSDEWKSNNKG